MAASSALPPVTLRYFALPNGLAGRGGGVRFLLLAAGVPVKEDTVDFGQWGAGLKQSAIDSGESPAGVLPVVTLGDHQYLEHDAVARLIARKLGLYGSSEEEDYRDDAIASVYTTWRNAWAGALLGSEEAKAAYAARRETLHRTAEAFLIRFGAAGASASGAGGRLRFSDALLFGLLHDDARTHGAGLRAAHPRLAAFYDAFGAKPGVKEWVDEAAARAAAANA